MQALTKYYQHNMDNGISIEFLPANKLYIYEAIIFNDPDCCNTYTISTGTGF
ncbi:MAG: hypothetical protein RLY16_1514 [Bacteroidota bacterium]|jgi:hypothetical protein